MSHLLNSICFLSTKTHDKFDHLFDLGGGTGRGEGGLPCFKEVSQDQLFQGVKSSKWLL